MSGSSRHPCDVFRKCEEYHQWGVKTCWVLDPESRRTWTNSAGERPAEVGMDASLTSDDVSIPLREAFLGLDD